MRVLYPMTPITMPVELYNFGIVDEELKNQIRGYFSKKVYKIIFKWLQNSYNIKVTETDGTPIFYEKITANKIFDVAIPKNLLRVKSDCNSIW